MFPSLPQSMKNVRWLPALPPLLALVGLALLAWATAQPVVVTVDGHRRSVRTHAQTVAGALRAAGIDLGPADQVQPALPADLGQRRWIEVRRARTITIQSSEGWQVVHTAAQHSSNILQEAGIRLLPGDRVWVDGLPLAAASRLTGPLERIRLERGQERRVQIGSRRQSLRVGEPTIALALARAGQELYEGDAIKPGWQQPLPAGEAIEYRPSRPVILRADGRRMTLRSAADTVEGVLIGAGVGLHGLDRVEPALEAEVPQDRPIEITRVREEVIVELEPVPFESKYQPLAEAEIDTQRVLETGSYGVRANQIRVRFEDGEEVERAVEGQWLAREPEPRVVGYGTNIVVRTLDTPDGTIEYWRAIEMWATSYSKSRAGVSPDAPNFGITASGKPLRKGLVAVDTSLIPFGTRMYVPGYGFAEAADRGSGVIGRWIDLGYDDDNYEPWAQNVTVYFLTPVPSPENITWILP